MDSSKKYQNLSPELSANFLSKMFFCWTIPFFKRGYQNDLQLKDIYNTTADDQCGRLADELEKNWEAELEKSYQSEKNHKPSLKKAIFKTFIKSYSLYGLYIFFQVNVLKSFHPIILAEYIRYFEDKEKYMEELGEYSGWTLGGGVVLTAFLVILLYHHAQVGNFRVGMKVRVACCSLVYRKLLRLNQASLGKATPGKLVNLLSNDLQRFDLCASFLHYIWLMPFQVVIGFYIMYRSVGIAALAGLGAMVLEGIPLQGYMSKIQGLYRFEIAGKTDHRIKLMNEIMAGIKVIKMYAWEKSFAKVVELARKQEIDIITKTSYVRSLSLSMSVFTERLSLYLTMVAFVLLGHTLTSDVVFAVAQLFNTAQLYICIFYPNALAMYAETKVSIQRLEEFLKLEENIPKAILNGVETIREPSRIVIAKATASWGTQDTLVDINLDIKPGTLCCIVGKVGSGKSSLLHMLLGELPLTCGRVEVSGEVSYASQEPWLFVSSVRDNILFGRAYDKERYDKVIKVCSLETDFSQFPFGDKTLVEERGVSLSGGQRARINLARAVYANADIYLFDDPLSAVDAHVGKHLFEQCILAFLKNKTRILVTHQLHVLKQADLIVIIDNGRIQKIGTYEEISDQELTSLQAISTLEDKSTERELKKKPTDNGIQDQVPNEEEPEESAEEMGSGSIPASTYVEYYRHGAGLSTIIFLVFLLIIAQLASNACDLWVTHWTNMDTANQNNTEISSNNNTPVFPRKIFVIEPNPQTIYFLENSTSLENASFNSLFDYNEKPKHTSITIRTQEYYIIVYSAFMLASVVLTPARSILFFKILMNASRGLHDKMFTNVLAAPMRFFDTNPSGRILSRFSNDMGVIDEILPRASLEAVQIFLVMSGILMMIFIVTPWMIIPAVVLAMLFYFTRVIYVRTAQDVKRLEGVNRAPVFSHILASLYGMPTIRASKAQKMVIAEFEALQDQHTSTWFMYIVSSEVFGFYLDVISTIFIALVTFQFLLLKDGSKSSGDVGLAISQSLILSGMLQVGVRQTAEVASNMISIERVLQYTKLKRETDNEYQPTKNTMEDCLHFGKLTYKNPDRNWPQSGQITFRNVSLRYADDGPAILKNLNVEIKAGEKIGIVGRTGAGKSSLISAIFRLAPIEGAILIDGIDTVKVRLGELRSKISIIPQEPVLFSSTIRYNLDPFGKVTDEILWHALENVELKNAVEDLNQEVREGGSNFSVGQRQLLCLARAIVRNNKILVLDEATANVDPHTDSLIQKTIRENFMRCTVLTIAHRLNTIMDSDKVLVMDAGQAVEFSHPHDLLQIPGGFFAEMVRQTGAAMEASLRKIAKNHFEQKHRRDFG